jgi:hypothetical protein
VNKILALFVTAIAWLEPAYAAGPVGFGSITMGMSKEAVESLKAEDGIYLASPMTEYTYKSSAPRPGEDKYDALIVNPFSKEPFKSVLTFEGGKLLSLYLDLKESSPVFENVKRQITEKYGEPKAENSMKEEQCIYRNGSNFKISSGTIRYRWLEEHAAAGRVETTLLNWEFRMCPVNLSYDIPATKLLSVSIGLVKERDEPKTKNPF